jgi:drug/metabolite transporter (DMT)-like permease
MQNCTDSDRPPIWLLLLAFGAVYLIWGSTFLAIRWAVADIPPFLMIGIRCAAGAAILLGWSAWTKSLARPSREELRTATTAGTLMFVGCHGLLAWAEQRVASGTASLYLTTIPVWLVVISSATAKKAPSPRIVGGLVLGVLGVAVLSAGAEVDGAGRVLDRVALVGSGLSWAAGSLVALHGSRPASLVQAIALQLAVGALAILPISLAFGEWNAWHPAEVSVRSWAALSFLVVGGTVAGLAAYTWLLGVASPAAVGSYAFVNPVVALGLGWMVGDQAITGRTLVACALVLAAVALSLERGGRRRVHSEKAGLLRIGMTRGQG